jgi:SAM-dependent methyltransferase
VSELKDSAARFNARASDYARYRPSYPAAAIDAVFAGLGPPATLTIVDVGAGTGISSRLLTARGAHTIAVEPNPEMRAVAAESGLDVLDSHADALELPDGSADAVASFQAFHWFATPATVAEFMRVLRPCGRVAIAWNERDDSDAFTCEFGDAVDHFGDRMALAGYRNGAEYIPALLRDSGLADVRLSSFPNRQRLDHEGLIGRVRSTSYAPREGPDHDAMIERLDRAFATYSHEGAIDLVYRTDLYLAEKP